ncbi:BON domain-containing protein [Stenotrophomonas koreensis]|nr:BON domain-containing protein [Stenotrophomonas koreensis]
MTQNRADSLIAADVVQLLGTHGQASQVLAQVTDGHVVLRGDVPSAEVAADIRARIQALIGVRGVDSRLQVDSGSRAFGEPGQAVRDNPDGDSAVLAAEAELRPRR